MRGGAARKGETHAQRDQRLLLDARHALQFMEARRPLLPLKKYQAENQQTVEHLVELDQRIRTLRCRILLRESRQYPQHAYVGGHERPRWGDR